MAEKIDWDAAQAFDKKYNIIGKVYEAFEADGATAHDLGLTGAIAVIRAWERIRTDEMARTVLRL